MPQLLTLPSSGNKFVPVPLSPLLLQSLPHLEEVRVVRVIGVTDEELLQLTSLRRLWVDSCQLSPTLLPSLTALTHLTIESKTRMETAQEIQFLTNLTSLKLWWLLSPQPLQVGVLSGLTNLTSLDLCNVSEVDQMVAPLVSLRSLSLEKVANFTDESFTVFKELSSLKLFDYVPTTSSLTLLAPKLTTFFSPAPREMSHLISSLTSLTRLERSFCRIKDEHLSPLTDLTCLKLTYNFHTITSLSPPLHTQLHTLSLTKSLFSADAFNSLRHLTSLALLGNDQEGLKGLGLQLTTLSKLNTLTIDDASSRALTASAPPSSPNLNSVETTPVSIFAGLTSLTSLNLTAIREHPPPILHLTNLTDLTVPPFRYLYAYEEVSTLCKLAHVMNGNSCSGFRDPKFLAMVPHVIINGL
eukprot:TRINITY_DN5791_c0_g1_i1.p1 TRINITY_DN5791_c0_g1~~TRINITY_DN5791_c0_g1_i1.p1  ORF type:complete len:483 (-),score=88.97 TRINITY_DN5791_c0_g1_i1:119-1357(-)